MEIGYWGPVDIAGGAWEIRWLAWRFGNMAQEVQKVMTHLLTAERKARSLMPDPAREAATADQKQWLGSDIIVPDHTDIPAYRELLSACERLDATSLDDPNAAELGRRVWQQEAMEAGRLGFYELKARLENAALRLTKPAAYRSLTEHLSELKAPWQERTEQFGDALSRLLEEAMIPCAGLLYRVKHTAGVWSKMQSKGLSVDEIQDLFAFRIIVPTEADCYAALGIIHKEYHPVITRFKDYIAEPKENGYKSLHTCVTTDGGPVIEIQIRSLIMDRQANQEDAAHWVYKSDTRETDRKPVFKRWWEKFSRRSLMRTSP